MPSPRMVATLQGVYFAVTGAWPLISIETFMLVTGQKYDVWLVKTLGVLILAVGMTLLHAAVRKEVTSSIRFLAVFSAAGLAAVDVVYVALDILAPIYLLDAFAEAVLLGLWVLPLPSLGTKNAARVVTDGIQT